MIERAGKDTQTSEICNECPKCSHHAVTGIRPRTFYVCSVGKHFYSGAENSINVTRSLFCKDCKTIFIDPVELPDEIVKGLLSNTIYLVHGPSTQIELFPKKNRKNGCEAKRFT